MGQRATMDYRWMTPGHVWLYRHSSLFNRIFFGICDSYEFMSMPISNSSLGTEAITSSDTAIAMYDSRDAFRKSYEAFRKQYPECDVDLTTFRCACKYHISRVQDAQPEAEQRVEMPA